MTYDPVSPDLATNRTRRQWVTLLPLLLLPMLGIIAGAFLLFGADDERDESNPVAAQFPTPAPVTFIPPTRLPATPLPTRSYEQPSWAGEPLPSFSVTTLAGESLALDELANEIVFLNFWASWCVPCRTEMPALEALHQAHADEGVRVIAVTNPDDGQSEDDIRAFAAEFGLTLTIGLSRDMALFERFGVYQIPVTYITDREGIIRHRHLGELRPDDIDAYLDDLNAG